MILEGQIVLFRFPQTDQVGRGLRPAVLVRRLPGRYDDWLICMVSTRLHQEVAGTDVIIRDSDPDFSATGLKATSLVRVTRLAVVAPEALQGTIGQVGEGRLATIRMRISRWILGGPTTLEGEEKDRGRTSAST
ncbi:MAG: type II toxin-antitoxin system PemK/MazF family toxin [Candidatus Schekmanbacteria bacterium]|nr:type II toxin-antitoxin system PemK/MazF family toxin [Candidatus Schekmanbacteria bacterium]